MYLVGFARRRLITSIADMSGQASRAARSVSSDARSSATLAWAVCKRAWALDDFFRAGVCVWVGGGGGHAC